MEMKGIPVNIVLPIYHKKLFIRTEYTLVTTFLAAITLYEWTWRHYFEAI
jgi:hypothetical protein